jgi:SAM-dependent methyltransferase
VTVGPSDAHARTLRFYDDNAGTYVDARPQEVSFDLLQFLPLVAPGGRILELGCGAGVDAAHMEGLGFQVVPTDGSPAMAALASERLGRPVGVMRFEDIEAVEAFDAVVACASLLHVHPSGLPDILRRVWRSLNPGGWHFASFKTDGNPGQDTHGRYYNHLSAAEAERLYRTAGDWQSFEIGGYDGEGHFSDPARWLTITAQKAS